MLTVTIDTNIIVDLEKHTTRGECVRSILDQQHGKSCMLRVPAISASELQQDGKYLKDFGVFLQRVEAIGLTEQDLLLPLGYWGIAFWNRALWTSPEAEHLERSIHDVLFSPERFRLDPQFGSDFKLDVPRPEYVTWRNTKCDVLTMWCHLNYGGDIFVSADKNFHKATKKPKLLALGAKQIVYPEELASALAAGA